MSFGSLAVLAVASSVLASASFFSAAASSVLASASSVLATLPASTVCVCRRENAIVTVRKSIRSSYV